eukprot:14114857-Alexandrium_andersonii.AAC.1
MWCVSAVLVLCLWCGWSVAALCLFVLCLGCGCAVPLRRRQHCQRCAVVVVAVAISGAVLGCGFADCGVEPSNSANTWADSESARTAFFSNLCRWGSEANTLPHLPRFPTGHSFPFVAGFTVNTVLLMRGLPE